MSTSSRQITKISRTVRRYADRQLRNYGIGYMEYEYLHFIRHHPGAHQEDLCDWLNVDKAAVARVVAKLEQKGCIRRESDEKDKRAKRLFISDDGTSEIRVSTSIAESHYYNWLMQDIPPEDLKVFKRVLEAMYQKSKASGKNEFRDIPELPENLSGLMED